MGDKAKPTDEEIEAAGWWVAGQDTRKIKRMSMATQAVLLDWIVLKIGDARAREILEAAGEADDS